MNNDEELKDESGGLGNYSSSQITIVKDDLHFIRTRPVMYVGSTGPSGLESLFFEAIDNAIDQFLAGRLKHVDITLTGSTVRVADDGPGLPFDQACTANISLGEHYFTSQHESATADGHLPHVHSLGSGLGLWILNALSEKLQVTSWQNNRCWQIGFERGVLTKPLTSFEENHPSGTVLEYQPDASIFPKTSLDCLTIRTRLSRITHLFSGLRINFQNESFYSTLGLLGFLQDQVESPLERPHFRCRYETDDLTVEVAAIGSTNDKPKVFSFANATETVAQSDNAHGLLRSLRRAKWQPKAAAIHVIMKDPLYGGPTRQRLTVPGLSDRLCDILTPELRRFVAKSEAH